MEPQAPQKPVMDVTAPGQRPVVPVTPVVPPVQSVAAPAIASSPTSLPVHEAPKQEGDIRPVSKPASAAPVHAVKPVTHTPVQAKAQSQTTTQPAGTSSATIIIVTLFVMALLAGLAVVVYLKSQ